MTVPSINPRHSKAVVIATALALTLVGTFLWLMPRDRITIGVEGQKLVTFRGARLSAVPYTHGDALAVRVVSVEPIANGIQHDVRYMAYGPGQHDLSEYLIDEHGRRPAGLPKLMLSVPALLPEEDSGKLRETPPTPIDLHTNYRLGMGLMWLLWGLLVVPFWLYGRERQSHLTIAPPPLTVSERLRQLLETAAQDALTVPQQADLEKLLLTYWSERLPVRHERLSETLEDLRQHPVAGPQVACVERWLHACQTTDGAQSAEVCRELLRFVSGDSATLPVGGRA